MTPNHCMQPRIVSVFLVFVLSVSAAAQSLTCDIGPIEVKLGGAMWQVTSCDDGRSLVFATMKDNPAMPFVFIIHRDGETSRIDGEGNGSKKHSAAAFVDLKTMSQAQFDELVQATKQVKAAK